MAHQLVISCPAPSSTPGTQHLAPLIAYICNILQCFNSDFHDLFTSFFFFPDACLQLMRPLSFPITDVGVM